MASNSGQIWSQFELFRGPMPVQVSCKFNEGPVKNELRRYLVHNIFLYNKTIGNIFGAQEQVTPI